MFFLASAWQSCMHRGTELLTQNTFTCFFWSYAYSSIHIHGAITASLALGKFHFPSLFKTHVCRCELFGDQPGPQSIPKGHIRIVPTTMLSKRVSGRSTCSTDWPCSKPVCVDASFLVISPGPDQSETDLFKSPRQRCSQKGFLTGVLFSNTGRVQDRVVPM